MNTHESTSTRPYFIRALHEWCTDNGFTPYLSVRVDSSVQVPNEYVKDGEIVLNIGLDATGGLQLGNDYIEFKARFGGKARNIMVPISRVIAIYARENGQGMAFPLPVDLLSQMDMSGRDDEDASPSGFSIESEETQKTEEDKHSSAVGGDHCVVQLVTGKTPPDDGGDAPRPPPATGSARPTLKLVK